jgi:hypothetical protein
MNTFATSLGVKLTYRTKEDGTNVLFEFFQILGRNLSKVFLSSRFPPVNSQIV